MRRLLDGRRALGMTLALAAGASFLVGQELVEGPLVRSSVQGVLDKVVPHNNAIVMKTEDGRRLGWRLAAPVIAEAAKFELGSSMWVIYRQRDTSDQAVTALGFPGVEDKPVYVNATGHNVVLRTGPRVDGECGAETDGQMMDYDLSKGLVTEDLNPCWCCAPSQERCSPTNQSGNGRIVLAQCFRSGLLRPY
jgi:hypothetical protein